MKIKLIIIGILLSSNLLFSQTDDEITAAFSSSYDYENKTEYQKAIEELITVYDASSYEINLRLGWLYYLNADYVKSQTYYKKCIALQANSIEAMLGYIYPTAALENWDDVLKTYLSILAIDSKNSVVNYRVALMYYYRYEFSSGLTYIKKVLELYPFDYDANVLAAQLSVSLGELTNAKAYYTVALHYYPTSEAVIEALSKL